MPTRTLLATAATGSGTSVTTSSFTPANNSLLTVFAFANNGVNIAGDLAAQLSVSGGSLTYTERAASVSGGTVDTTGHNAARIFTAPVTTGTSMTVTLTAPGNCALYLVVVQHTGHDAANPVGATAIQTIRGNGPNAATGAQEITLSGAPASASDVIAALHSQRDTGGENGTLEGSGWTELHDQITGDWVRQTQARTGSTSTTVRWEDPSNGKTRYGGAYAAIEIRDAAGSAPTISSVTPSTLANGQTGIVITGTGFGATQGAGQVRIGTANNNPATGAVTQAVTAWSDTSITITAVQGALPSGSTVFLYVTENGGTSNSTGFPVSFGASAAQLIAAPRRQVFVIDKTIQH